MRHRWTEVLGSFLILAFAAVRADASCGTVYTLVPSPPATANWTNTAVWSPTGFPGQGASDCASATSSSPTTITVNSAVSVLDLTWSCPGCVVEIVAGGQLTVAFSGTVANGAKIVVDGGTLVVDAAAPIGLRFNADSTLTFKNGTISGSGKIFVDPGAILEMTGAGAPVFNGMYVENKGIIDLVPSSPASLLLTGNSLLKNLSGGLLNIGEHLTSIDNGSGTSGIENAGGFLQKNDGGFTSIAVKLNSNSSGAIDVQNGQLDVAGGGVGDAPFTINSGATLSFPADYTLTPNGTVAGGGTLLVDGGDLSIGGVTEPTHFSLSSGSLTGDGFLTVTGDFFWSGGTITGNGGTQIAGTGHGYFTGDDGVMLLDQRPFDNYGSIHYSATASFLTLANDAVLANYGTFDFTDDGDVVCGSCSSAPLLKNSPNGQITKGGGSGTSTIDVPFQNDSGVNVYSGTLEIAGSGTHNGNFFGLSGTTLLFTATSTVIDNNSIFTFGSTSFPTGTTTMNGGSYEVQETTTISGGTLALDNTAKTTDFNLVTGTLDAVDFTMTGTGTWSCGMISGTAFLVDDGATLTIDGANSSMTLRGATLTNDSDILYTASIPGNHLVLDGGTIINNSLFDLQTDAPIELSGFLVEVVSGDGATPSSGPPPPPPPPPTNEFQNHGTLVKSGGSGTTSFGPSLGNDGQVRAESGVIRFENALEQNGGSITLGPGSIEASLLDMTGGLLDGSGTFTGDVSNSGGEVQPGTSSTVGDIDIDGSYDQSSGGSMTAKLSGTAAGQFDRVDVSGIVTLDGSFTATLIGGFEPPNGSTFDVLTYSSLSGTFATENLPTYLGTHGSMISDDTASAYVLEGVVTPASADLTIAMSGPSTYVAGAAGLDYVIEVANDGPDPISGTITVTNTLPVGTTSASGSGSGWSCGAPVAGVITCTNSTTLPSGQSLADLTITMTAPANPGLVQNSASASSPIGDPALPNTASVSTTITASVDLAIAKSGPGGVTSGQNIVWTVSVTNHGPSAATGVIVSDPTPANTTFVSNSGGCLTAYPCSLGTLNAGQTVTITSTYSTSPSFTGNVTNTATVSSSTTDSDSTNDSASHTTNVGAQADLSITKSGPSSVVVGQNLVYTVTVTNDGPSPATDVVVSDPTPIGIAFQSNSGACATAYPCLLGTLNAGQSATITSTYTVPNNYAGTTIVNAASVSSSVNDPDNTDDTSQATTNVASQADLAIAKSGPPSIAPGQLIVYTIQVDNLGPSSATGISVADPTPAGLVFVSNAGACATAFPCAIGTLAPGGSATITSTYSVPAGYAGASITNTATVTASTSDSATGNNTSSVTTPVVAQSDVAITKSGPPFFDVAQNVAYTLSITNHGPLVANNVFVTDPTPAGLTFVSNSGACSGPFPCGLGTLNAGQTVTITTTFAVPSGYPGTSITNTASVSSSTTDVSGSNNTSTVITPRASGSVADLSVVKQGPGVATPNSLVDFYLVVTNNGPTAATSITISDPTPAGLNFVSASAPCASGFPCSIGALAPGQSVPLTVRYFVQAAIGSSVTNTATVSSSATDPQPSNDSSSATVPIVAPTECPESAPLLIAPLDDAVVGSPVTLSWSAVAGATSYRIALDGDGDPITRTVFDTTTSIALAPGEYTWSVTALGGDSCASRVSAESTFVVCGLALAAPVASVVAETTTGQTYSVAWEAVDGAATYELQESHDDSFAAVTSSTLPATSASFTKHVSAATPFFYRVRAISSCGPIGPFSGVLRVVVVPVPEPDATPMNVNVPAGSTTSVNFQVFVPGLPEGSTAFVATVDKPWLTVVPTSGIVPPEGILVTVSADPTALTNGTWTGTVLVVYGSTSVARTIGVEAATPAPYSIPVSISLVTPVTPAGFSSPAPSAMMIPAAGHLAGLDSSWRSDVRVANTAPAPQKYRVTFNAGIGGLAAPLKSTVITVEPGGTIALDDVVRSWFGAGSLGESSNGALIIEPLDAAGRVLQTVSTTTAISSRTFNASANGTLGQFIPALPFTSFLSRALSGTPSFLNLQQLAQTSAFRTNLGLLEGSGRAASVLVSVFDNLGINRLDLPLALRGGEQKQLNAFLAERGIELANGRIEARVTEGDGRVTGYASVVDNGTNDPFLVFGAPAGQLANRFVVPGVADLETDGGASWRTDVRLFNGGTQPQNATLAFYPTGDPANPTIRETTLNPGEVKALDGVLRSYFDLRNAGGALHVTTATEAPLVVTARTYDERPGGTVGQFVPAVVPNEAAGLNGRVLQILQAEESVRYRTNLGVAEVSGKPVVAEIEIHLPDSRVRALVRVPLAANEFRQFPVLASLNLGALYNTRISVRVVEGEGRVTAYGSMIDQKTGDPTYIPAQ